MYFHKPIPLFQSVQVLNSTGATSIIVYGDSISQQGYWTNAFAKRIEESYPGRYAVVNSLGTLFYAAFGITVHASDDTSLGTADEGDDCISFL